MLDTEWIVIDTKSTGVVSPIFVVELAAQRMRGWQPHGSPMSWVLNHRTMIPLDPSRVHPYTPEVLERDGKPPYEVYREFGRYVGERSVTAFDLAHNWDEVLTAEWQRMALPPRAHRGLCIKKLTQRLLDPIPAGDCKLQTLRKYYGLPAHGAHTSLGNVGTVVDLVREVLRPLAEARGLCTWAELCRYSEATWYPARIPFGKYKGRLFREAATDRALYEWLAWLCESSNPRSAGMGRWYMEQLSSLDDDLPVGFTLALRSADSGLVVYTDPDIARLKPLIEAARARLAALEASYTSEHHAVLVTQSRLFELVRPLFQMRDQLHLRLEYRRRFLDTLLSAGEEEAAGVVEAFERVREERDADFELAAASAGRRDLTADDESELKSLWRKLVRLFHPDRYMDDDEVHSTYQRLTTEINRARDEGDIKRMREIANDPQGFMARQGWGSIALGDSEEVDKLHRLYEAIEGQIIATLEAIDALHHSPEYELHQLVVASPGFLAQIAEKQSLQLEQEVQALNAELEQIEREIEDLNA